MKQDGRGKHGKCGRKKKKDPRIQAVNIRLNSSEKEEFIETCESVALSQADCLVFLLKCYKKLLRGDI